MSISMLLGRVVLPVAAALLAITLAWKWVQGALVRSGWANAQTAAVGDGVPSSDPGVLTGPVAAEGRVVAYPGAKVIVGTEVLATIVSMPVRENVAVHKGDLLVELRADEVRASLREAHSRLTEAEVGLRLERARAGLDRILPIPRGQSPEARRESLTLAGARLDEARAAVDRLEAEVAKYRILAPIDGVVVARHADAGETVSPAAPLVTIVDLTRLRVEAEVDEFDIPRITPGSPATITAEGYRGRRWSGRVEEIASVVVARRPDPPTPAGRLTPASSSSRLPWVSPTR